MKFRSPTDEPLHIGLTSGHTIVIPPEGIELPQIFRKEAIAQGAEPDTGETDEQQSQAAPQFNRKEAIAKAINEMLDGAAEDDFTKDGKPDLRKLNARVGFQVARDEADAIWGEITAPKAR